MRATWQACSSNWEFWEPSEHSLIDTGKPRKPCADVAGRRTFQILRINLLWYVTRCGLVIILTPFRLVNVYRHSVSTGSDLVGLEAVSCFQDWSRRRIHALFKFQSISLTALTMKMETANASKMPVAFYESTNRFAPEHWKTFNIDVTSKNVAVKL